MQAVLCSSEQSGEQFVTPTNEPKIAPPRESFATLLFAGELNASRRHRGANITGFRRGDGRLNLLSQRSRTKLCGAGLRALQSAIAPIAVAEAADWECLPPLANPVSRCRDCSISVSAEAAPRRVLVGP